MIISKHMMKLPAPCTRVDTNEFTFGDVVTSLTLGSKVLSVIGSRYSIGFGSYYLDMINKENSREP